MLRIQFNGSKSMYNMDFSTIGEAVNLKGSKFPKKLDTGFMAYRLNGDFLGDYSEYTNATAIKGGYQFTKDADTEQ